MIKSSPYSSSVHVMQPTSSVGNRHSSPSGREENAAVSEAWAAFLSTCTRPQFSSIVAKGSDLEGDFAEENHWYLIISLGLECLILDCFPPVLSKSECWGCLGLAFVLTFLPRNQIPNHGILPGWRSQRGQCWRLSGKNSIRLWLDSSSGKIIHKIPFKQSSLVA